jgi:hypothetical protein
MQRLLMQQLYHGMQKMSIVFVNKQVKNGENNIKFGGAKWQKESLS